MVIAQLATSKKHDYVGAWLLEPNDKPIGEGLERFERNFEKEKEKLEAAVETLMLVKQNTSWSGQKILLVTVAYPSQLQILIHLCLE